MDIPTPKPEGARLRRLVAEVLVLELWRYLEEQKFGAGDGQVSQWVMMEIIEKQLEGWAEPDEPSGASDQGRDKQFAPARLLALLGGWRELENGCRETAKLAFKCGANHLIFETEAFTWHRAQIELAETMGVEWEASKANKEICDP